MSALKTLDIFEQIRLVKRIQAYLLNDTEGDSLFVSKYKSQGVNRLQDAVTHVMNDEEAFKAFEIASEKWKADNQVAKALVELEEAGETVDIKTQRKGVQKEYARLKGKVEEKRKAKLEAARAKVAALA